MTKLIVIDPIDATHEGPTVPDCKENFQLLHLRQGDIDGACGPYCLFMALMVCGVAERCKILGTDRVHGNTSLAKAFKQMEDYSTFFRNGTYLEDLAKILTKTYKSKIQTQIAEMSGTALRPFIEANIKDNHPVILGLTWGEEAGHWVLIIGLEYLVDSMGNEKLWRYLILDPSEKASNVCAWNGVIEANGSGGIYPYVWWQNNLKKVQFDSAMAISRLT